MPYISSFEEVMKYANLVVTSRFHCLVSSLSLRVPVYVIVWGYKYREILKSFSFEDNIKDYQYIDARIIAEKLIALLRDEENIRKVIAERIQAVRKSSEIQFKQVQVNIR